MHHLMRGTLAALSLVPLMLGTAAQAATRTYIVTDFDSVRVEAPIAVAIATKRGVTARGEGDAEFLERLDLSVSARVLTVRLKPSPFEGRRSAVGATPRLLLTVPALRSAQLAGSGTLAIEGMNAQTARIMSSGSGMLSAAGIDADTLTVLQQGSGTVRLTGKARKSIMQLSGSGVVAAPALTVSDLEVTAEGAGVVNTLATRSAKVVALGAASVTVDRHPACTVRHTGSGTVTCSGEDF